MADRRESSTCSTSPNRRPATGSRSLLGAGSPGLVLVREPDLLRVERSHELLALGLRVVELAVEDRRVTDDDGRMLAGLDDDDLRAARVARRWDKANAGQ